VSFLKDLNPAQREAAQAVNGPVMIIAGAGSGKTRVLTYRIANLLASGVPPYEILALTFTNKAAGEMRSRIEGLVAERSKGLWMGTFHSMFARILRREAQKLGYTQSYSIYDSDDSLSAIKNVMQKLRLSTQQIHPGGVRSRISYAKNQMLTPEQMLNGSTELFDEQAAKVYAEYQKTLERSNAMDFDDLLIKPIELFTKHPDLLEKYQYRFKFLLVDEFQDTNKAQYKVLRLLGDRFKNVCVVGDDAQSIYSFRGAEIRNILNFPNDYPECQTFKLEQNYRSTRTIIGTADILIRNNKDRLKKELWTENQQGDPIRVFECVDDQDEALKMVRVIREEVGKGEQDLKDIALLYRTNAQSRALEDALRRSGVPYTIVGGIRFYERKEIKDVIGYFRAIVNPQDQESLLRIINYPARGIGNTTIGKVKAFADQNGIMFAEALRRIDDVPDLMDRARKNISSFMAFLAKYDGLRATMSVSEWSKALVDDLGILRIFKEERTAESLARWENIQELLSALMEFAQQGEGATLEAFLEEVSLVSDIDTWEGEKNAVTLMTLHASKGLEFPIVCVTGLEEGLLPFAGSQLSTIDVQEERRLFYVGMTRAERRLYLSHAATRFRFGEASFQSPSRFLSELGDEGIVYDRSAAPARSRRPRTASRPAGKKKKSYASDDGFVADDMPDYESESQEQITVRKGLIVVHEAFGRGKVIEVQGRGEQQKAVVQFNEYGLKSLILKYARLTKG
jgi:DNA helicase-2/ATP-dependent DNA helicase PcrA